MISNITNKRENSNSLLAVKQALTNRSHNTKIFISINSHKQIWPFSVLFTESNYLLMKKILLIAVLFTAAFTAKSQVSSTEIGVRFGDVVAIDATVPIAAKPRLHPTLYISDPGAALGVYFDWLFPVADAPGLRLYPGVGPELYFYNDVEAAIAGNFGVEYAFDFPMTLGIDWRPSIMVTNGGDFYTGNWGLMVRYRF